MALTHKILTACAILGITYSAARYAVGNVPEYKQAGEYQCEKYKDRLSAKLGNRTVTRYNNYDESELTYPEKMTLEDAVKAINACEKAFELKAEKEQ